MFAVSVTTAIPSKATMFSTKPPAFSSSVKALDTSPISAVPFVTASTPALEPVNCGSNCKFG